jgi:hypothetical protein
MGTSVYFADLRSQVDGGKVRYGGIDTPHEMNANLVADCIPEGLMSDSPMSYDDFLVQRRLLMAVKIKLWFESL